MVESVRLGGESECELSRRMLSLSSAHRASKRVTACQPPDVRRGARSPGLFVHRLAILASLEPFICNAAAVHTRVRAAFKTTGIR